MGANKKEDSGKGENEGTTAAEAAVIAIGGNSSGGGNSNDSGTENKKSSSTSQSPAPSTTSTSASTSASGIDSHPFARGSVIEVLHGGKGFVAKETFWWSDSEEEENEQYNEGVGTKHDTGTNGVGDVSVRDEQDGISIRLCDIIDRVADGDDKWRYYVHYRDFNRRMDEWIGMERIVSPPSIGNAKARALKKQEEKLKRKQAKLEEEKLAAVETLQPRGPRTARRTSEATQTLSINTSTTSISASAASTLSSLTAEDTTTPRMTRRQRRRTDVMEGGASLNSDGATPGDVDTPKSTELDMDKELVTITAAAKAETTQIGQHVIATLPAQELDEHEGLDEASLREHEEVTKVKNVSFLELGEFRMETWYFTPLPKELLSERGFVEVLYVCEFSFNMFSRKSELLRYQARELPKNRRHPPGNEIYRHGNLSVFEVDGFEERIYCQNLCYIAKLFLDHKTLYFDVDPFLFYIVCEVDNRGFHPVGYFSKEKYSDVGYNLACILTFPCHQRKGYGRFIISFSYELSKKEEKVGSPEKPMSDLGQQAYKPYWMSTIIEFLQTKTEGLNSISIMDIAKTTSIMAEDIVFTLNQLGILKIINGVYFIAADTTLLEQLAKKHPVKEPRVIPSKLHWTPYLTDIKRDKFSIHSKRPTLEKTATTTIVTQESSSGTAHRST